MPSQMPAPMITVPLVHRDALVELPKLAPPVAPPRRIMLATTGTATSASAARTAAALAARHGATVSVVSVFRPRVGYPSVDKDGAPPPILPSDRAAADAQLDAVAGQIASLARKDGEWAVQLVVGHIGPQVARAAAAWHADLVVMGNGRPIACDRPLGDRGAVAIAACADSPLLAVSVGFDGAPHRVMFAIGRDSCSVRAVHTAVAMFPEPDAVLLAHVRLHPAGEGTDGDHDDEARVVAERIAEVRAALSPWHAAKVDVVMLGGDPVQTLLALARRREVDLIVGGLHGASYEERAHARNITLRLLAEAETSVLLLPVPPAPRAGAGAATH